VKKERREKDVVMEIPLDVVMEKTSLEEKTSLSTQVGPPDPTAWASPLPTGDDTSNGPTTGMDSTITMETSQVMDLFMCLRDYRRTSEGTDVTCLLTSRHVHSWRPSEMRLKMDEDLEKCAIEAMPVVSSLCFHTVDAKNKSGYHVNLRCICGAKQVGTNHMLNKRPTPGDCLRELGRVIHQDHGPTCVIVTQKLQVTEKDDADVSTKRPADEGAVSLNATEVMMLHRKLKMLQQRVGESNKTTPETEKERDDW
jgi:hypothetical protein